MESADGIVIVYAHLRRPDIREEFWSHMEDLLGERVTPTIYELSIADWDDDGWKEEVEWIQDLLAGTRASVIVWQFSGNKYSRYTIMGNA
jgi:hypothetical protein